MSAQNEQEQQGTIPALYELASSREADKRERMSEALKAGADINAANSAGRSALLIAADAEEADLVDWLLAKGANPDTASRRGITPLIAAIQRGHLPIVKSLLRAGANPDQADELGSSPLMEAANAQVGELPECVEALIKAGANVEATSRNGTRALLVAAARKRLRTVELLVKAGADVEAADSYGVSALNSAALRGREDEQAPEERSLLSRLFKERKEYGDSDETAAYKICALLIKKGAKPGRAAMSGTTPLANAMMTGMWRIAQLLVENGADPNVEFRVGLEEGKYTPLTLARANGKAELAEVLKKHGAKADFENSEGIGPTEMALSKYLGATLSKKVDDATKGKLRDELLSAIQETGKFDCQVSGMGIAAAAVFTDDAALLEVALASEKAMRVASKANGSTALHVAIVNRKEKAIQKILQSGKADVEAKMRAQSGEKEVELTPLMLVATNPVPPLLSAMLRDSDKARADMLKKKLRESSEGIAASLLAAGAQIDAPNAEGRTALHWAARSNAEGQTPAEFISWLIEKGASLTAVDEEGDHAATIAAKSGNVELTETLLAKLKEIGRGDLVKTFIVDGAYTAPEDFSQMLGYAKALKKAIELGADIEAQDEFGNRALVVAAYQNMEELVDVLLELGAKVDGETRDEKQTPLMLAVAQNHPNISSILLAAGADIDKMDAKGKDAYAIAYREQSQTCLQQLRERRRDIDLGKAKVERPSRYGL